VIKRKEKILISAIELLDAEGVNGVTTKNLAMKQHVSEPALYRQYKGKQEILNYILDEYASYDEKIEKTITQSLLMGKEAIIFYVTRYAELYQNYSELTTVMFSMDLYFYQAETRVFMEELIQRRLLFLENLISSNPEDFELLKIYTSRELASMINGILFSQVYEWRMTQKQYKLDEKLISMVSKLL